MGCRGECLLCDKVDSHSEFSSIKRRGMAWNWAEARPLPWSKCDGLSISVVPLFISHQQDFSDIKPSLASLSRIDFISHQQGFSGHKASLASLFSQPTHPCKTFSYFPKYPKVKKMIFIIGPDEDQDPSLEISRSANADILSINTKTGEFYFNHGTPHSIS